MYQRVLFTASLLLVSVSFTWAQEEAAELSPAEIALQQQQIQQQADRFQVMCERILLSGVEPQKSELITNLNGQTCEQAALAIANPAST